MRQLALQNRKQLVDNQDLSYVHAIYNFGKHYSKMTFIDTDEYLVPIKENSIANAINNIDNYSNILLPYTMFSSDGLKGKPNQAEIYAYTKCFNRKNKNAKIVNNFKCIVNPNKVDTVSTHRFNTIDMSSTFVNEQGIVTSYKVARNKFVGLKTHNLQLNHYYIRSEEEFNNKLNFFRADTGHFRRKKEVLLKEKEIINADLVDDYAIINFLKRHNIHNSTEFEVYKIS